MKVLKTIAGREGFFKTFTSFMVQKQSTMKDMKVLKVLAASGAASNAQRLTAAGE